ncbi:MAG: peptidylprolyl isomerase [Phycisphaerales bacterium]|nr:peptidylprolyl isomerase [Phycisphaerales bacterium]
MIDARRWNRQLAVRVGLSVLTGAGICLAGCQGAASKAKPQTTAERRASRPTPTMLSESDPTDTEAPVSRLKVNGEVVLAEDVIKPYTGELVEQSRTLSPEAYRRAIQDTTVRAAQQKISEMLLYQAASARLSEDDEKGLDKVVDEETRRRVTELGGGVQWQYEQLLRQQGLTLEEERARLRRQIVIQRHLHLHVYPKIQSPTRDELWELFNRSKAELEKPERRRMSLIEVDVLKRLPEGVTSPTREQQAAAHDAAMEVASAAKAALDRGKPFADAAREYSEGLHADAGGDWGWVSRDALRERWQKAVAVLYELPAAGVSDVVETPSALFIVGCMEIEGASTPEFQTIQPELVERYRRERSDEMLNALLKELHQKARIEPERIERFLTAVAQAAPPYAGEEARP